MIYVIDGPDGAGKSTLASSLSRHFKIARYTHMRIPDPVDRPFDYWMERLLPHTGPVIIDRLHWSEDVYGGLFRGGSKLTDLDRWQLEGWLLAQGAAIIQCLPPRKVVLENALINTDKPYHHDAEMITSVYDDFCRPWKTNLPVFTYDYTSTPVSQLFNALPKQAPLPVDHEGIGGQHPRYIFVADRHNICNRDCYSPFVLRCPAGDYLRRALEHVKLNMHDYHIINGWRLGRSLEGTHNVNEAVGTMVSLELPPRRFVAMGRSAEQALQQAGIFEYGYVHHPQHMNRFYHSGWKTYGCELMKEALGG